MPLIHSSSQPAFKQNVEPLMGEVKAGSSAPVKSRAQALAVAYDLKRRGRAFGGPSGTPPWYVRNEARNLGHVGPIMSSVPGRTDRHNISVPSGSYVLPADHLSALGQGNTMAGVKIVNNMFSKGPYGGGTMPVHHGAGAPRPPAPAKIPGLSGFSDRGGARGEDHGQPTPVIVAGGEYVLGPETVKQIGGGDLKQGHKILDAWVLDVRKSHVKTLRKLPPPVKS